MSTHFWIGSSATLVAAAALGLGLGTYVTSPQKPVRPAMDREMDGTEMAAARDLPAAEPGPATVRCTGCGPTLEERRMAADMAGLDADGMVGESHDPVVQDYMTQDVPIEPVVRDDLPPTTVRVHRLPPQIERFAAGEPGVQPVLRPVAIATPPPPVPAEPVEAGLPQ